MSAVALVASDTQALALAKSIAAPIKWISLDGTLHELRLESGSPSPPSAIELKHGVLSSNSENAADGGDDIDGDKESTESFFVVTSGGELVPREGSAVSRAKGVIAGQRIYWSSGWSSTLWLRCEDDMLKLGERVSFLDGGNLVDGKVQHITVNETQTTYDVIVYGETTAEEFMVHGVARSQLRSLKVGIVDQIGLIKDMCQYFADIVLDGGTMVIFVRNHQWKYLFMNASGIVFSGLATAATTSDGSKGFCVSFLRSVTGVEFLAECREAWRRGYRTERFTKIKFAETSFEGMVSMGVQLYALVYEDNYNVQQIAFIFVSIASSIYGYAQTTGVEFGELLEGRKLVNPDDRRQFVAEHGSELVLVRIFRIFEVTSRGCLIASLCFAFRPYGIIFYVLVEAGSIMLTYWFSNGGDFGHALINAIIPGSWLAISEPFLAPNTYMENLKTLVTRLSIQKALGAILMVIAMFSLRSQLCTTKMIIGHRLPIFVAGLLGTPVVWLLSTILICFFMGNPRLNQMRPEGRGQPAIRTAVRSDAASADLLCC